MSHDKYRWLLVKYFVQGLNDHRDFTFVASDFIFVQESISRWYVKGGHWINLGIPIYIVIDRKPEMAVGYKTLLVVEALFYCGSVS